MSLKDTRTGLMSLIRHALHPQPLEDEHLLRRARPDRDLLALQILDRRDVGILAGDDRHAAIAGRGEHHDRLAGGRAERRGGDAEHAEIDGLVTTAFLPSVGLSNGMTSTWCPRGMKCS